MSDKTSISFRLFSQTTGSDVMMSSIGLDASVTWSKGDARRTPKGASLDGFYSESFAVFPLVNDDARWLSESIAECIARLKHAKDFFASIRTTGGRAELFIGWFLSKRGRHTVRRPAP